MHYITTNKYKLTEYQNQKNIVYGKAEEKKPLKILKTTFLIFILSLISAIPAFALGWSRGISRNAWWYDLGNGNYHKASWQWLDGNNDGISECYHFDDYGWMAENTITPDSYTVNQSGAWTVNNVVQTRSGNVSTTSFTEQYEREVLSRINQYRAAHGLRTLQESAGLNHLAKARAEECSILFSHTRPQGGSITNEADVCCEIIASGQHSPMGAVQAWQNSISHNQLMLRSDFVRFGSGYYLDAQGNDYWVVLFSYYN